MKQVFVGLCIFGMLLLVQGGSAAPGDLIWQQTLGGSAGEEWGYSVDSTADGGMLITGIAYSEDNNITGARGNGDLWVVRLGPDGKPLWNRAYGGNGSDYGLSVKTLADGGSVIIGTTGSNNGDVTGYHGNGDLWILRLSPAGDPIWNRVYGGNMTDEGGDIIQTPDGGYMLTGYTMSNDGDASGHHGGGDLWMIHLDQEGKILWQKVFGGSKRDSGSSIIRTSDGGYAMTGNTYSNDGDVTSNHGSSDLWVVKTDVNGSLLWQKTYGGSKLDWGHSIIELPGGDLLVAGVTASADGDVHFNHGAGDIWVLRLSPQGDLIWEKTYGGSFSDNVWKAEASPHGGAYLVGETFSVDGDISGNHGDADLWVSEIDANGSLLWQRTLGGSNYESGSWVKLMPDGNLGVVGTTRSTDGDVVGSRGGGDLWALKIDARYNSTAASGQQVMGRTNLNTTGPVINAANNSTLTPPPTPAVMSNVTRNITAPPLPALNATVNTTSPAALPVTVPSVQGNQSAVVVAQVMNSANATSTGNTTATLLSLPNITVNTTPPEAITPVQTATQNKTPAVLPTGTGMSAVNSTVQVNLSINGNVTLKPLPGSAFLPGDPDGDGKYEDLNGNGKVDLQDPTIFFNNFDWIQTNLPNQAFDFNGNGVLDFGDINALFKEASG